MTPLGVEHVEAQARVELGDQVRFPMTPLGVEHSHLGLLLAGYNP